MGWWLVFFSLEILTVRLELKWAEIAQISLNARQTVGLAPDLTDRIDYEWRNREYTICGIYTRPIRGLFLRVDLFVHLIKDRYQTLSPTWTREGALGGFIWHTHGLLQPWRLYADFPREKKGHGAKNAGAEVMRWKPIDKKGCVRCPPARCTDELLKSTNNDLAIGLGSFGSY